MDERVRDSDTDPPFVTGVRRTQSIRREVHCLPERRGNVSVTLTSWAEDPTHTGSS